MPMLRRGTAALLLIASPFVLTACMPMGQTTGTGTGTGADSTAAPGSAGAAEGTAATANAGPDWLMIGMIALLGIMVIFMFRNSRKRRAEQEKLKDTMVPGVEVMTNFGLFGTIVEVDTAANTVMLQISPGTSVKVHRQTLVRIVEPAEEGAPRSVEEAMEIADREQRERDGLPNAPEFGERIEPEDEGEPKK